MGVTEAPLKRELQILFNALCDGLRQEVRQRYLASMATNQDFSMTKEREAGVASSLASQLRLLGFGVQIDAYFPGGPSTRRPDFGIWLPASKKYIYLELKTTAWGADYQYYYQGAIEDIKKLYEDTNVQNQLNGLIALGFSKPEERPEQLLVGFKKLSKNITENFPYEKIGVQRIDLQDMDKRTSYAVIGLWFRKPIKEPK